MHQPSCPVINLVCSLFLLSLKGNLCSLEKCDYGENRKIDVVVFFSTNQLLVDSRVELSALLCPSKLRIFSKLNAGIKIMSELVFITGAWILTHPRTLLHLFHGCDAREGCTWARLTRVQGRKENSGQSPFEV